MPELFNPWLLDAMSRGHKQAAPSKRTLAHRAKRRGKNARERQARRKQRGR